MADDTPPDSIPPRRPVRMGLRVVARHSAGRYGGRALARDVVESHRPKHLDASTRLSRSTAAAAPPPPPPPPAPAGFAPPAPAAPSAAAPPDAGSARPEWVPPEMSDFAAQWMFGDQQSASSDLVSMAQAEKLPEPSREQKLARFLARGGLERSRGARIVEGAGTGTPISSEELGFAASAPDPGPKKLARAPLPATPAAPEPPTEPAPSTAANRLSARAPSVARTPAEAPPSPTIDRHRG